MRSTYTTAEVAISLRPTTSGAEDRAVGGAAGSARGGLATGISRPASRARRTVAGAGARRGRGRRVDGVHRLPRPQLLVSLRQLHHRLEPEIWFPQRLVSSAPRS